jgi:ankyrin repeat protein
MNRSRTLSIFPLLANPQKSDGQDPLFWAPEMRNEAMVRLFLNKGAAVDKPVYEKPPILFWARIFGHVPIVQLLLDNGAAATIKDKDGRTPLEWAEIKGHAEAVG